MKMITKMITVGTALLLPTLVWAQLDPDDPYNPDQGFGIIETYLLAFLNFLNNFLLPAVIALALLVFFWGLFQYFIVGGGDEDARAKGRQLMLYGIIAFFLFASILGIVDLIASGIFGDAATRNQFFDLPTVGS